jgi:hypothetical protein
VWEIYPTCSRLTSAPLGAATSRATNTGALKTSGQTNPRARLHQGDADLCTGGAPAYSRFIPPGGPKRCERITSDAVIARIRENTRDLNHSESKSGGLSRKKAVRLPVSLAAFQLGEASSRLARGGGPIEGTLQD